MKRYTAVYEKRGRWYVGHVKGVPGANTQGRTLREVRENLQEALALVLEARRAFSEKDEKPSRVIREPILVHAAG